MYGIHVTPILTDAISTHCGLNCAKYSSRMTHKEERVGQFDQESKQRQLYILRIHLIHSFPPTMWRWLLRDSCISPCNVLAPVLFLLLLIFLSSLFPTAHPSCTCTYSALPPLCSVCLSLLLLCPTGPAPATAPATLSSEFLSV